MTTELTISPGTELQPAALFTPTPQAARRMLEFFTAQLNNPHTRRLRELHNARSLPNV